MEKTIVLNPAYVDIIVQQKQEIINKTNASKTLKVITNVINDNGGTKKASDFLIAITGNSDANPK